MDNRMIRSLIQRAQQNKSKNLKVLMANGFVHMIPPANITLEPVMTVINALDDKGVATVIEIKKIASIQELK